MSRRPYVPRCACGSRRGDGGACLEGCDAHRKPHQKRITHEAHLRATERQAEAATMPPSVREIRDGAERAYPGQATQANWRRRAFRF